MLPASYNAQVREYVLATVWSLWAELGLSGWTRRHAWTAVDLEPLLIATSHLGRLDARLLQEAVDWSVLNHGLVSAVRLRNHLKLVSPEISSAFEGLSATVGAHQRINWGGNGKAVELKLTGRSSHPELSRPALVQLRLRAAFGLSARAELLHQLAAEPLLFKGLAELSQRTAYGRDNVADALGFLADAGLVEAGGSRNQRVYRLAAPAAFESLFGPMPAEHPDWAARLRVMVAFCDFAPAAEDLTLHVNEIHRLLSGRVWDDLARQGATWPLSQGIGGWVIEDFRRWSLGLLRRWAGSEGAPESADVAYVVRRLVTSAEMGWMDWVGTVHEPGRPSRDLELPEWEGDSRRTDHRIADDSTGAVRLAHAMFEDAFRRTAVEIGPYWSGDSTNQLVCREFASERLKPIPPGGVATWSDGFLREWWADRLARISRPVATAKASEGM